MDIPPEGLAGAGSRDISIRKQSIGFYFWSKALWCSGRGRNGLFLDHRLLRYQSLGKPEQDPEEGSLKGLLSINGHGHPPELSVLF